MCERNIWGIHGVFENWPIHRPAIMMGSEISATTESAIQIQVFCHCGQPLCPKVRRLCHRRKLQFGAGNALPYPYWRSFSPFRPDDIRAARCSMYLMCDRLTLSADDGNSEINDSCPTHVMAKHVCRPPPTRVDAKDWDDASRSMNDGGNILAGYRPTKVIDGGASDGPA